MGCGHFEQDAGASPFSPRESGSIDFKQPAPSLARSDSRELRKRVLALSAREARKLGISKSTLHYLRENAASYLSFDIYRNVR